MATSTRRRIPAFCPLCASRCGCEAITEDDRLVAIAPAPWHPTGKSLCAKGRASPALIEAPDRLLHPLRRTRPKGDATPRGRVRARARLNTTLADGIVAARHGWWQACPELDLPPYDALDGDGANINLAIGLEAVDPVSGAAPHRCYPCQIEKLA